DSQGPNSLAHPNLGCSSFKASRAARVAMDVNFAIQPSMAINLGAGYTERRQRVRIASLSLLLPVLLHLLCGSEIPRSACLTARQPYWRYPRVRPVSTRGRYHELEPTRSVVD